jgi:hypothetical protein
MTNDSNQRFVAHPIEKCCETVYVQQEATGWLPEASCWDQTD